MKIKPEHFEVLKGHIEPEDVEVRRQDYRDGRFPRSGEVMDQDLDKRYRWDLMNMIPLRARRELLYEMYLYMNDDHIDTALRRIVRPL